MGQFDSAMKVIGSEYRPANDSANRMYALLFAHNRVQNAISSSVSALEKGFKNLVSNYLKAKQFEVQRKERDRQAREEFSKEEHKNKQTTEGEA
jgi:Sec-independent protein translocase protein TatA